MAALAWDQILGNAIYFSNRWKEAEKEEAEAQPFTLSPGLPEWQFHALKAEVLDTPASLVEARMERP